MIRNLFPTLLIATLSLPLFAGAQVMQCVDLQNNLARHATDIETNNEVTTLQGFLVDKGYLNTDPIGNFGPKTEKAVKEFQTANKIYNSGFVGPITRAKIRKVSGCAISIIGTGTGTTTATSTASCIPNLKLCANGSYAARIGPNCTWAVCPTTESNTSSGNTSGITGGTTSNTTTSGGTKSGGTSSGGACTAAPPAVDPGRPPTMCFNRYVSYYEYDKERGFLLGGADANYLNPTSQGRNAWRAPVYDTGPGHMIIIRFKTDEAGYISYVIWGHDESSHPILHFISPTPCDYTWAYEAMFNPLDAWSGAFIQNNGGGPAWFRVPVLAENQVEKYFTEVGTSNGIPYSWSFGGKAFIKPNKKAYLKPNTYYYFHLLFADIYKGGVTSASVGSAIPGVTNNAQLTAASDSCGDYLNTSGYSQNSMDCLYPSRLDGFSSFFRQAPYTDSLGALNPGNTISGLPAPGSGSSSCVAPPVSGACGSANGGYFSNNRFLYSGPTTDLCTAGSLVIENMWGPFKWKCEGSGGGTTASCSAGGSQPPPPEPVWCILANGTKIPEGERTHFGPLTMGWFHGWYKNGNTCYTSSLRCYDGSFSQGTSPNYSLPTQQEWYTNGISPPAGQQYTGGPVYEDEPSCKGAV